MDTRAILFLVVMVAIGVVGLGAFLIYLWTRQGQLRETAGGARREGSGIGTSLIGPAILAALGVVGGIALLVWLLVANAPAFSLNLEWTAGTVTFVVIMGAIAAAGPIAFIVYLSVLGVRSKARGVSTTSETEGKDGSAAQRAQPGRPSPREATQSPGSGRLLGLAGLLLAFFILNWALVDLSTRYQLMTWLMYPAVLAFALVLLFDKATRTWSYKTKIASFREWLLTVLIVFLFFLTYLNLLWSNAQESYNALIWDVIGIVLFVFVFWLLDRKVTRLRFLVAYGYLILLPIGLIIWTAMHGTPTRIGIELHPRLTLATLEAVEQVAVETAVDAAVEAAQQAAEEAANAAVEAAQQAAETPIEPAAANEPTAETGDEAEIEDDGFFSLDDDEEFFDEGATEDDGFFSLDDDEEFFDEDDDDGEFFDEGESEVGVTAVGGQPDSAGVAELGSGSWWETVWPFFFLALIFFVLEIILLLAIEATESSTIAMLKDLLFVVLYAIILITAIPGSG